MAILLYYKQYTFPKPRMLNIKIDFFLEIFPEFLLFGTETSNFEQNLTENQNMSASGAEFS